MNSCVTLSNRLENLLLKLKEKLFADVELRQKTVVVASRGMKRWVKGKLLASRGSFFGITLVTLDELLKESLKKEALAVQIYGQLPEIEEIADYLNQEEEKRVPLAVHLASLFLSYQELGFTPPKKEWQSKLFLLGQNTICFPKGDLYFFGFSHLPKPFLDQIKQFPSYFLSPTLQFWEELKKDEHPLLGSLGRMGRVMSRSIPQEVEKLFSLPQEIADHPSYTLTGEEFLEGGEMTLLKSLQADLLLMREGEKVELPVDNTIEVHVASSIEREVEVLRDRLFLLMGQEGITPGEILVMAKDISPYLPLLKAHFEKDNLPFKVTFQETSAGSASPVWNLLKICSIFEIVVFKRQISFLFLILKLFEEPFPFHKTKWKGSKQSSKRGPFFGDGTKKIEKKVCLIVGSTLGPLAASQKVLHGCGIDCSLSRVNKSL